MNTSYVYQSAQVGEFRPAVLWANGPTSYSSANGDVVYNPGSNEYISFPSDCTTKSGNYFVRFIPSAVGNGIVRAGAPSPNQSGWLARWYSTGASAGSSGVQSVTITAGGTYTSPAVPTVTFQAPSGGVAATGVAIMAPGGATVQGVLITNPGSGYTTVPTVTFGSGGATGTAVLTPAGSTAGIQVANGTNLAAELVQFGALVSQL
jgi:hypothetical protein